MSERIRTTLLIAGVIGMLLPGCGTPQVDFSKIERPARAGELDAYEVFVGSWTWEAEMLNATESYKQWKGTAAWKWTLDKRCLHGVMSSSSGDKQFDAEGIWSWHPTRKKYIWWMFNNWGYPQQGSARYDGESKTWTMSYRSIGLDGTESHGVYDLKVVDNDTLSWHMTEWVFAGHFGKKAEMKGTYKRVK